MEPMNLSQTILSVFYAIVWGAIFGVSGRWLMFQPILCFPHIRHRLLLSMLLVNVLPIAFFVLALWCLKDGASGTPGTLLGFCRVVLAGILPAFAIFGFYRLWMGIVELAPTAFYEFKDKQGCGLQDIDPTIESLHLNHPHKCWNLLFAMFYFFLAAVGLALS